MLNIECRDILSEWLLEYPSLTVYLNVLVIHHTVELLII